MKEFLDSFIDNGLVYSNGSYNFIQLKDLVSHARETDLSVKVSELKELLVNEGWTTKRTSILTEKGYQSKDIWINPKIDIENTRSVPVTTERRMNLEEAEESRADEIIDYIFDHPEEFPELDEAILNYKELIFTNKGIKDLMEHFKVDGDITRLASVIRSKANHIVMGKHFYGVSSRTVLFKNYYKITR